MTPDDETKMLLKGINNQLAEIRKALYVIALLVGFIVIPIILKAFGIEPLWDPSKLF